MSRQHKVWIDVTGGSGKSFGIGRDSTITLNVNVGSSSSNSKHMSKIKIECDEDDNGEIFFWIEIDGQTYRTEQYNRKKTEFRGIKGFSIDGSIESQKKRQEENESSLLKMTGMVAAMGSVLTDTKQEANEWKERMIKAGLGNMGLQMPEDWHELTEDEKEQRLNNVIANLQK